MLQRSIALALAAAFGIATASFAQSSSYNFVRLTSFEPLTPVPGGGISVYQVTALSDSGRVAFTTERPGPSRSIVVSDGTSSLILGDTAGPIAAFSTPDINGSDQVSSRTILDAGGDQIVFGDASPLTTIVGPYENLGNSTGLNDSGVVVFSAEFGPSGASVTTFDGNVFSTIEDESGPFYFFADPVINNSGQVAYVAVSDSVTPRFRAIRFFDGTSISTIVDSSGGFPRPSLSDSGEIAYMVSAEEVIRSFDGASTTLVADTSGPFASLGPPTLNNAGAIAFAATTDDGRTTINVHQGGTVTEVISTGDTLDGKTIGATSAFLLFGTDAFNNDGSLAFTAVFSDSTSAVYRADPIDGYDFGDAGGAYPTLEADDGARHLVGLGGGPLLGSSIDADPDGQPTANADGDDLDGTDDEDGISFSGMWLGATGSAQVIVTCPSGGCTAFLDGWIDFDRDGSWAGAGEQVFSSELLSEGLNVLEIPVGATTPGSCVVRMRLSTSGGLFPTGVAADGEVEDLVVHVTEVPLFADGFELGDLSAWE